MYLLQKINLNVSDCTLNRLHSDQFILLQSVIISGLHIWKYAAHAG